MLCRYLCLHAYFNLSRKKLQGRFRKSLQKQTFPLFYRHFLDLLIFSEYFGIFAFFDNYRSFLHHGQDMLKFGFFLNLTADFGAISFKKSGCAKTDFVAFLGQVVFLGQA